MTINVGSAFGTIDLDASGVSAGVQQAVAPLKSLQSQFEAVGRDLTRVGATLTAGLTAPLGGFGASAVNVAADFEQAMAGVGAISGATADQLSQLTAVAEGLGRSTSFSATGAAEGMKFLAQAGFEVSDVIAAMPGLLDTAAAGATDLGTTADIVSNILSGFGLEAGRTGEVADVLTSAFTSSNTDLVQLGEAMKFVAPVAASLNVSLEDTAAAVGILSDAGIQASQAGTTLRGVLTRLAAPTGKAADVLNDLGINLTDTEGNFIGLPEAIAEFERGLSGLSQTQQAAALKTVVGQEALSGFLALLDRGSGDLDAFSDALDASGGTAERIAGQQLDTLQGQIKLLKSAFEGLQISVGNAIIPVLTQLAESVAPVIQRLAEGFSSLDPTIQQIIVGFGAVAVAIGPIVLAAGVLSTGISTLLPVFAGLGTALAALVSPLGLVAAGLAAAFAFDVGGIRTITTEVGALFAAFAQSEAITTAASEVQTQLSAIGGAFSSLLSGELSFADFASQVGTGLGGIGQALSDVLSSEDIAAFKDNLIAALGLDNFSLDGALTGILDSISGLGAQIETGLGDFGIELPFSLTFDAEAASSQIEEIAAQIAAAGSAVSEAFGGFVQSDSVTAAAGDIQGGLEDVRLAFADLLTGNISVGDFGTQIADAFGQAAQSVRDVISGGDFATLGNDLVTALGLDGLATRVSESLSGLAAEIGAALGFEDLLGQIESALEPLAAPFARLRETVAGALGEIGAEFGPLQDALAPLREAFVALGEAFGVANSSLSEGEGGGLGAALRGLAELAGGLALTAISALTAAIEAAAGVIEFFVSQLTTGIEAASTIIGGLADVITGIFTGDFETALSGAREIFDGFVQFIGGSVDNVTGLLADLTGALGTLLAGGAENFGLDGAAATIDGIRASINEGLVTVTTELNAQIEAFSWANFVPNLEWPDLTFSWGDWISSFEWPALPTFAWGTWISSFVWPSLPSFDWADFLPDFELPEVPSFPGWSSLITNPFSGFSIPSIPGFATGTNFFAGGLATVAEQGPELLRVPGDSSLYAAIGQQLLNLPRGTQIFNAAESQRLVSDALAGLQVSQAAAAGASGVNVTLNATLTNDMDVESVAYAVARVIRERL